jgi:hypothetical protein
MTPLRLKKHNEVAKRGSHHENPVFPFCLHIIEGGALMPDKTDTAQAPFWKTLLTGFLIGIGAIAPGVSGGAFAVIFGLYAAITDAVAHIYHDFRKIM